MLSVTEAASDALCRDLRRNHVRMYDQRFSALKANGVPHSSYVRVDQGGVIPNLQSLTRLWRIAWWRRGAPIPATHAPAAVVRRA